MSALRVRNVVYKNFNTGIGGVSIPANTFCSAPLNDGFSQIPGNDDSGAMAALLTFHILGLYPVVSTRQFLIGSPLVSSYTLSNNLFNTKTTVTVEGFDSATLNASPANGTALYVTSITIDGKASESLCWVTFDDLTSGANITIEVDGGAAAAAARGCGSGPNALPSSLETGGF